MLDKNAFLYDVDYYIKNIRYTDEYLNGELIFTNSGHVAVGYKFFNNHLSNIDGCMIYLGTCSSGVDDTLAKAFLDKGASTVIGNSGTICTTYNLSMIKTIYEQMLCDTGSDNHYDTLQTALNFAFDKNGKYCCEEDKSHPIIFGDNNFRLSNKETDKTLNSNFVSGKYLICTDGKYICAKSDAIYYKENITAKEKKISSADNACSLLSDGNIIYYVEGSSSNSSSGQEYEKKKVYKTTTKDGKSEYLFTSEGKCELIACENNSLYYLDVAKSGNDDYKYLLKKYDIGKSSVVNTIADWSDKVSYYGDNIAYCIDNTMFVNEQGSLCLYNIDKDEYTKKIKSSDGVICDIIKEKICFEYTKNGKKYISAVDSKGKMKTSAQVPDNFDFQIMDYNGKYALFFNTDQSDMDKMFDLYKFDFESGKIETPQNEAGRYKNKNYFVTRDLKEPENIYFMYNLGLYDESTNKILNKKHDDFDFDITKQMWIVDGYVVDWNFNTYKIYSETIEMTTTPVNSNTDNKADWKNLYVDYVNSLEDAYDDIWIVDIDDDDVPELFIQGKYHVAGAMLCWIDNNKVNFKPCGQNFGYKKKSGSCYAYTVQMGASMLIEYTLNNGNISEEKVAFGSENNNSYTWNNKSVSQDEYWNKLNDYTSSFTNIDTDDSISKSQFSTAVYAY